MDVEHVALAVALRNAQDAPCRQGSSGYAVPSARPLLKMAMSPQAAPQMNADPLAETLLCRRVALSVQQRQPAYRLRNADQPGL